MTDKYSFELQVRESLKYFKGLMLNGGTKTQFKIFVLDKCDFPSKVYTEVLSRAKMEVYKEENRVRDRNEPFKTNKKMPTHLFANKIYNKILGSNVFY